MLDDLDDTDTSVLFMQKYRKTTPFVKSIAQSQSDPVYTSGRIFWDVVWINLNCRVRIGLVSFVRTVELKNIAKMKNISNGEKEGPNKVGLKGNSGF